MTVLLPTCALTVRVLPHPEVRDAMGAPVAPADTADVRGPWPGAAHEQQDGTFTLRVDPRAWRINPGDRITDGLRTWVVSTALLASVPDVPDVDYIAVTASLEPPRAP